MAKRKMVKTVLDNKIAELAAQADHKTLAVWACDCVERALPYFEELDMIKDSHDRKKSGSP